VDRWIGLTPDAAARLRETSEGCAAGGMASCRPTE